LITGDNNPASCYNHKQHGGQKNDSAYTFLHELRSAAQREQQFLCRLRPAAAGRADSTSIALCAPPGNAQPASPVARKRRPSVILIIVGLLLLVMALRIPAAQLFGIGASGVITVVKQEIDSSSDRMDYNYSVAYSFTTADGKHQTGSYNLNRVYNSGNLPNEGSVISVKYLPVLPFINFADGQDNIGWSTFLTLVIGVAILVLGATGVVNISRHR
jgi:hypothetical protein